MSLHRLLNRVLMVVVLGSSAVTGAAPAKKGPSNPPPRQVDQKFAQDALLVDHLQKAFRFLEGSNGIYGGHRKRALDEINAAIANLQREMGKRGLLMKFGPAGNTSPANSHAILKMSRLQLMTIDVEIRSLPSTPPRDRALGHVREAVRQIDLALRRVRAI